MPKVHPFLRLAANSGSLVSLNFKVGVNLSGAEYTYTGFPTNAELDYWKSKNVNLIRYPFSWMHLQPTLFGPLDTAYLNTVLSFVDYAASIGTSVILDMHSYGYQIGDVSYSYGDSTLGYNALPDMWSKLVPYTMNRNGVHGYDIANEPSELSSPSIWPTQAQAIINAIRLIDTTTPLYVEGDGYSSAGQWTDAWTGIHGGGNALIDTLVTDPSNKIVWSAHCYPDHDNSGRYSDYDLEVALSATDPLTVAPGTQPDVAVQRIKVAYEWAKARGYSLHIGEFGVPNTDVRWLECLDQCLAYCQTNNIEITIWAGGTHWGDGYPYSVEPRVSGFDAGGDARQTAILSKYTNAPQPTKYFISNSLRGVNNTPTQSFIEYRGILSTPATVILNDNGANGVFNPAQVVIPSGVNGVVNFTYTSTIADRIFISSTNNRGLTDPSQSLYVTKPDLFMNLSSSGISTRNIYALRRVYTPYSGPVIRLQRDYDDSQKDFYFELDGSFPRTAIQAWAYSNTTLVATIYDQSPNGRNITAISGYLPTLTLSNSAGYPEITWASGKRMQFPSPTNGQTEQTLITRAKNLGGESNFIRLDYYAGPFNFGPGTYNVSGQGGVNAGASSINFLSSGTHNFAGTFKASTTNGHNGYVDGVLVTSANAPLFTFSPSNSGETCEMGYFKFYTQSAWSGSWQELFIFDKSFSASQISSFNSNTNLYYSTTLPTLGTPPTTSPYLKTLPTFSGVFQPNRSVVVSTGVWSMSPTSYTYQWYIDNTLVSGSVTNTYSVTAGDLGKTPKVVITAINSSGSTVTQLISSNTIIAYAQQDTPYPAPTNFATLRTGFKGVNISGAEFQLGNLSARLYYDYTYPQAQNMDYYANSGFSVIRVPFDLGRFYKNIYSPLDTTQLAELKYVVEYLGKLGLKVILDPHNYGTIYNGSTFLTIGKDAGAADLFADFWSRMATKFLNYPNVIFNLMNEPHLQNPAEWKIGAIPAINAIRATGATQKILIPGTYYTGAHSWVKILYGNPTSNGSEWAGFTDINFAFEMHQYLDSDSSGTQNPPTCTLNSGSTRLVDATNWARTNGFKIHLGEIGWSKETSCPPEGIAIMNYMSSNSDVWEGWTYWSSGASNFGATSYALNCDPASFTTPVDSPQVVIMKSHL